jgi:hypothetical protein
MLEMRAVGAVAVATAAKEEKRAYAKLRRKLYKGVVKTLRNQLDIGGALHGTDGSGLNFRLPHRS